MSIFRAVVSTPNSDFLDSFSNLRTAPPAFVSDGQFTYDLQPFLYEVLTTGGGSQVEHDATNRSAICSLTGALDGDSAYMQSYDWHRYQTGRGQEVIITFYGFNPEANTTKFARYGTETDGMAFEVGPTGNFFRVYSSTDAADQSVPQASWNIDRLDGTGRSGVTLDPERINILFIDFQALYAGRVRMGFSIGGNLYWAHEFVNANLLFHPYIATANLPIQVGLKASGSATSSCAFLCSCILSRGGQENVGGYSFLREATVTAASGARTHLLSIQPKATFNGISNRTRFVLEGIEVAVTGTNPVKWELCIGDVITGTTTFDDVNTAHSAVQFNTAGTTSGTPAVVVDSGYVQATNQARGATERTLPNRYPITLDAAGNPRALGRLTLLVTGIGGASDCRGILKWREIR